MEPNIAAQQFNVITLKNLDSQPFELIYNNQSYGVIQPGETRKCPKFLADHCLKHLIDQILNHLDIPTNNVGERAKWAAQIVISEDKFEAPQSLSESEKLKREVEQLNSSDLNRVLADKKNASDIPDTTGELPLIDEELLDNLPAETPTPQPVAETISPPVEPIVTPAAPTPEVLNSEAIQPASVASQTQESIPLAPATDAVVKPVPSRTQLYDFAKNTLKMDLTHKETMDKLENMSVPEIIDELQYYEQTA